MDNRSSQRGLTWVSLLLLVLAVAGGYWAFVFVPVYLDNAEMKQVCAQAANLAYSERNDGQVKAFLVRHIEEKFAYDELQPNGMTRRASKIDFDPDQDIHLERTDRPPHIVIDVTYGRTVSLPIVGGQRTLNFALRSEQDLSTVKW